MTDDKKLSVADLEERLLYDDDDDAASSIDMSMRKHGYYYGYGFYGRYGLMPTRTTEIITIKV